MSVGRRRHFLLGVAALLVVQLWPTAALAAHGDPPTGMVRQGGQTVEIEVVGDPIVGRPSEVAFRAANPAPDANQGSITVSLPGNPNVEIVSASAQGARLFQPGEQMFNFGTGRNAPIANRAVELFISSWPTGTRHELRLRLTGSQPYRLMARATFRRANGSFANLPASGAPDQQGAPTRQLEIQPRQAAPPTAPPPPTATRPPAKPTSPPPPPATFPPPIDRVAPGTPGAAQPNATAAVPPTPRPLPTEQPLGSAPPTAAPTLTSVPKPSGTSVSSGGENSLPMLLAGIGIIVVGLGVGLLALVLIVRRQSAPGPRPVWPQPPPPHAGQPGAPFGPGGTSRMPGVPGSMPGTPPSNPVVYPGTPPPWGPPAAPANPPGTPPPNWPYGAPAGGQPPAPVNVPPWDRPGTPAPPSGPQPPHREPTPAPTFHSGPTNLHDPGSGQRPPTPGPYPGSSQTPSPPNAVGVPYGQPSTPQPDRYTDRVLVGRGGMGSVYRAYDSRLRRPVALKIMHADLGLRPGFLERFIREAQVAAMLEHPNIVTVYDIESMGDSIQMVMSWIDGRDLEQVLEQEGALPPMRVTLLLSQMAAALDHAHLRDRPVLHRDIKPSNIMIGPNDRAILTDFGIARLMGDVSLTQTGQMVGTPAFMAPEVVQGEEPDARADVYALGVVLYQMLTGQAPFQAQTPLALLHAHVHTPPPSPRTVVPSLPPAVDGVLARALAKDPNARFQTAGALARASVAVFTRPQ